MVIGLYEYIGRVGLEFLKEGRVGVACHPSRPWWPVPLMGIRHMGAAKLLPH